MIADSNGVVGKVAALYDIHGNLPALDTVLGQPEVARADLILVGGDNLLGPMPREVLDRLMSLGSRARFICGNCDRMMVEAFDGNPPTRAPPAIQENIKWAAGQLDKQQRDFLAKLPLTLTVNIESIGPVLFCHATPQSDEPIFTVRTPADRVASMFSDVESDVVVCGHTHMQFDRRVGDVRIINAGSVGMSFGPRGAHWLSIGPSINLQRTPYDFQAAAERIAKTSYPQAEMFASKHVLNPPSEEEMLAVFDGKS
jgi:putative phosphoesterase